MIFSEMGKHRQNLGFSLWLCARMPISEHVCTYASVVGQACFRVKGFPLAMLSLRRLLMAPWGCCAGS